MKDRLARIALPIVGVLAVVALWAIMSTTVPDLPSPLKTWQDSKVYIMQPLVKRGEMDQGIGLLAYQPDPCRKGIPARGIDRHSTWISAGFIKGIQSNV